MVLKKGNMDVGNESNLHTCVQMVMKSDSSTGGDQEGQIGD